MPLCTLTITDVLLAFFAQCDFMLAFKARLQKMDSIRDSDERDTEKKTKLCHKGGPRIEQLLGFHQGAVGDGPQGEQEVVGDKGADVLVAHEAVLLVEARLPAS